MSDATTQIIEQGLQVVLDKDGDTFVAKAVCAGKTIAKGENDRHINYAVEALVSALIALAVPKTASVDDNLAKAFS